MTRRALHWIPAICLLGSCATAPPPASDPQQSAFHMEGLETIEAGHPGVLLVKTDHHMASYDYTMVDPIVLTYRTNSQKFSLAETQKLEHYLRDAVARELVSLEPSRIVAAPGPCVLRMQTAFIDLELANLPDRATAATTFVDSFGTVTLIHQIIDSETGDLLLRYIGRWRAGGGQVVGGGDAWVHMTRTFDRMLHALQHNLLELVPYSQATSGPRAACGGEIYRTLEAAYPQLGVRGGGAD